MPTNLGYLIDRIIEGKGKTFKKKRYHYGKRKVKHDNQNNKHQEHKKNPNTELSISNH